MKIVAIIPAHLNSIRFPKKIIYPILGLPMIEHVRRRTILCKHFDKVVVATCDKKIFDLSISSKADVDKSFKASKKALPSLSKTKPF